MSLLNDIKTYAATIPAGIKEKKGVNELSFIVAERKTFLNRQKLEYTARFRIDDEKKIVKFTEILKESGSGMSTGDTTPGFGFKKETYNTTKKERRGSIEEQSTLFSKEYKYNYDFKIIREKIRELATKAGYAFDYQITPISL